MKSGHGLLVHSSKGGGQRGGRTLAGRSSASAPDGNFRVSEIWDSREQFEAFGPRLMTVLADVGITLSGEPEMLEIHNIIKR
jgi:hypothetical protein